MKVLNKAFAVGIVGVALIAGSARGASAGMLPGTQAATPAADDGAVKSMIEASLKKNSSLAPRDIDVDVTGGVVTLKGNVRTTGERTRAGSIAKVKGVTRVDNRIEVDPKIDESKIDAAAQKTKAGLNKAVDATATAAEKTKEGVAKGVGKTEEGVGKAAEKTSNAVGKAGDKLNDASLTTKVKAGLSGEALLKNTAIDVDTSDHVVTLRGTVGSIEAKARAGEIAGKTDGVARVVNELVLSK